MNNKWRNFVVGAMIHEGVTQVEGKYAVNISDLTLDVIKDAFPNKYQRFVDSPTRPMYKDPVYLPQGDGSSKGIIDDASLNDYKDYIMNRVGDVEIILDPSTNKATIEDPKFKKREAGIGKEIAKDYGAGKYQGD